MKTLGMFEAKTRFSEVCAAVAETGEPRIVTKRGRPFVKIIPWEAPATARTVWELRDDDEAAYGPCREDFSVPERAVANDLFVSPLDEPCR